LSPKWFEMSKYHAKKFGNLDANHIAIASALRSAGFFVGEISGSANLTDLMVARKDGVVALVEIKTDDCDASFQLSQLESVARFPGYLLFVTNECEAIEAMKNLDEHALTKAQKDKLLHFAVFKKSLSQAKNPRVAVSVIEKLLQDV